MAPTVTMAKVPRWERTSRGWGSLSLMQPMPQQPRNEAASCSNLVRKGVSVMEWICRWQPALASQTAMPALRVPRWLW